MNVIAVRASRARGLRVAVTAETAALCMLAVAIAAFVALTWATWGNPGRDTGYDLIAGARSVHRHHPPGKQAGREGTVPVTPRPALSEV